MFDFEYKKSLGQNFIKDDNIINKIVKYSEIDSDTLVIEIGPGAGSLSKKVISLCGYAILYEIDVRLRDTLNNVLKGNNNYEIIFGDFLEQDISKIRKKYNYNKVYVIANLPYYITTPIIKKLMDDVYPDKIVIMVQDEVADRLSANYGSRNYGMISVLLGAKYSIKKLFKVSRKCFFPVPNVDSAVVCLEKNDKLLDVDNKLFESFIKDAFQFKRKNLRNNLKKYDLALIEQELKNNNYNLSNRAEEIPVEVYIELVKKI